MEMKVYSVIGYVLITLHLSAGGFAAPEGWGFLLGAGGALAYLLFIWFVGGMYVSNILHMGVAHKTLEFQGWFVESVTVVFNVAGIYINPVTWVNRHRHHHAFSDHEGDPHKLAGDGFWKTLYLCAFPYACKANLAKDAVLKSRTFRMVSNPYFAVGAQFSSFGLLWLAAGNWVYALALWVSARLSALWINMIQNYWSHDRRFGTRRYDDPEDDAMNIGEWFPVTASFSSSLQNNHHHEPNFLRNSHDPAEYDFGFMTVRALSALGLVRPTSTGARMPDGVALQEVGF